MLSNGRALLHAIEFAKSEKAEKSSNILMSCHENNNIDVQLKLSDLHVSQSQPVVSSSQQVIESFEISEFDGNSIIHQLVQRSFHTKDINHLDDDDINESSLMKLFLVFTSWIYLKQTHIDTNIEISPALFIYSLTANTNIKYLSPSIAWLRMKLKVVSAYHTKLHLFKRWSKLIATLVKVKKYFRTKCLLRAFLAFISNKTLNKRRSKYLIVTSSIFLDISQLLKIHLKKLLSNTIFRKKVIIIQNHFSKITMLHVLVFMKKLSKVSQQKHIASELHFRNTLKTRTFRAWLLIVEVLRTENRKASQMRKALINNNLAIKALNLIRQPVVYRCFIALKDQAILSEVSNELTIWNNSLKCRLALCRWRQMTKFRKKQSKSFLSLLCLRYIRQWMKWKKERVLFYFLCSTTKRLHCLATLSSSSSLDLSTKSKKISLESYNRGKSKSFLFQNGKWKSYYGTKRFITSFGGDDLMKVMIPLHRWIIRAKNSVKSRQYELLIHRHSIKGLWNKLLYFTIRSIEHRHQVISSISHHHQHLQFRGFVTFVLQAKRLVSLHRKMRVSIYRLSQSKPSLQAEDEGSHAHLRLFVSKKALKKVVGLKPMNKLSKLRLLCDLALNQNNRRRHLLKFFQSLLLRCQKKSLTIVQINRMWLSRSIKIWQHSSLFSRQRHCKYLTISNIHCSGVLRQSFNSWMKHIHLLSIQRKAQLRISLKHWKNIYDISRYQMILRRLWRQWKNYVMQQISFDNSLLHHFNDRWIRDWFHDWLMLSRGSAFIRRFKLKQALSHWERQSRHVIIEKYNTSRQVVVASRHRLSKMLRQWRERCEDVRSYKTTQSIASKTKFFGQLWNRCVTIMKQREMYDISKKFYQKYLKFRFMHQLRRRINQNSRSKHVDFLMQQHFLYRKAQIVFVELCVLIFLE